MGFYSAYSVLCDFLQKFNDQGGNLGEDVPFSSKISGISYNKHEQILGILVSF